MKRQKHHPFLLGKKFTHGTVHLILDAFFWGLRKRGANFTSWGCSSAATFQHDVDNAQNSDSRFSLPLVTPGIKGEDAHHMPCVPPACAEGWLGLRLSLQTCK